MIEVVLDFKDISNKPYGEYEYIPKNITEELVLFMCEKLNLPLKTGWDAFLDDLREIQYREFMQYIEFTGNFKEHNGWTNYEQYLRQKEMNLEYGLKNDDGIRDDLKLIFINFLPFFIKYKNIATIFLEIFAIAREEAAEYKKDTDILVDMEICIKS